jgi:hypothetical protein
VAIEIGLIGQQEIGLRNAVTVLRTQIHGEIAGTQDERPVGAVVLFEQPVRASDKIARIRVEPECKRRVLAEVADARVGNPDVARGAVECAALPNFPAGKVTPPTIVPFCPLPLASLALPSNG